MRNRVYDNIIYIHNFSPIGGVESFVYYMARKYGDKDLTFVYKSGNEQQIQRLRQYVRVKKFIPGEKIKCRKAIFNYVTDIINNVEAEEYIQVIHTNYKKQGMKFHREPKINKYYGVTKAICKAFTEYTGLDCELAYNPIYLEKPKRILHLISATRLTAEKGKWRIEKMARLLDEKGYPYIWTIFTNDTKAIDNPNIIYKEPLLYGLENHIADSDYLVQLSDSGERLPVIPLLKV